MRNNTFSKLCFLCYHLVLLPINLKEFSVDHSGLCQQGISKLDKKYNRVVAEIGENWIHWRKVLNPLIFHSI